MVTLRLGYLSCAAAGAGSAAAASASAVTANAAKRFSAILFLLDVRVLCGLSRRNNRQQHVRLPAGGEMQRVAGGENRRRPVIRIDVQERADALHRIRRVGQ